MHTKHIILLPTGTSAPAPWHIDIKYSPESFHVLLCIWYLYIYLTRNLIQKIQHKYSRQIYRINILRMIYRRHKGTSIFGQWCLCCKFHSFGPLCWCTSVPMCWCAGAPVHQCISVPVCWCASGLLQFLALTYYLLMAVSRSCQSLTFTFSVTIWLLWNAE